MEARPITLLPSPEVTFESGTHTYRNHAGVAYVSVTTLLKAAFPFDEQRVAQEVSQNPNSRYYGQKPEDIINYWNGIAETGTELHKAVESWNRTGMVPAESELCHDAVNFFAAGKWKGELYPEQLVWCHDHQLAGTVDLIEDCGEQIRLWDIKTSRRIDNEKHEKFSLQLFIYAKMLSALLKRTVTPRGVIWFEDFKHKPTQPPKILPLLPVEERAVALLARRKTAITAKPPYVRPEGLLPVTEDDTEFIRSCFSERQTSITCSGSAFLALMARKDSVRVNAMRIGKTPGTWICTVTYLDPKLL